MPSALPCPWAAAAAGPGDHAPALDNTQTRRARKAGLPFFLQANPARTLYRPPPRLVRLQYPLQLQHPGLLLRFLMRLMRDKMREPACSSRPSDARVRCVDHLGVLICCQLKLHTRTRHRRVFTPSAKTHHVRYTPL